MPIDVEAIKRNTDIVAVIGHYIPLKKAGISHMGLCPFHGETTPSFSVTRSKGFAFCYGCGANHDVISFLEDFLHIDFVAACKHLGANINWEPSISVPAAPPIPPRVTVKPPPTEPTPSMALHTLGEPIMIFPLLDVDGSLICYEARYDDPKDKSRMWTWGYIPGRKPRWACGAPNHPRPLYGLHRLGELPDAPVLITEGPKKADAAHRLLGIDYASLSLTGGANAVPHHDYKLLASKDVLLWPDADFQRCKTQKDATAYGCSIGDILPYNVQPGQRAMFEVARILHNLNCTVRIVTVGGMEDGWDVADAEKEGWNGDRVRSWLAARTKIYSPDPPPPTEEVGKKTKAPPVNGYSILNDDGSVSKTQSSYVAPPDSQEALLASAVFQMADDIEMEPIRWLWKGRIAKGKISLLVGNPGLGKSQTCASITSIVTNGGFWPDAVPAHEKTQCEKGSVIILSSEDDPKDTVKPRLVAAGADTSRVALLTAINEQSIDKPPAERAFSVQTDLKILGAMMDKIGGVRLLIIDPISAYMGAADSYKDADVRGLLLPLANMAAERNFSVLLIAHLTKAQSGSALLRVQGSVGLVALARAVWGVSEDPDDPDRRLFISMKNNLGKSNTGLAFRVQGVELPSKEGPIETSRIMWETDAVTLSADEAMNTGGNKGGDDKEDRQDSNAFLHSLLSDGPIATNVIMREAKKVGFAQKTMYRAKERIKAEVMKIGSNENAWLWHLKGKGGNSYADREN